MSAATWAAVALAGGLAAGARFALDSLVTRLVPGPFPAGILVVNVSGALALGALSASGARGAALTVLAGGLLGSYTTFSTWMLDTERLRAAGLPRAALANLLVSQAAGLGAFALGRLLVGG